MTSPTIHLDEPVSADKLRVLQAIQQYRLDFPAWSAANFTIRNKEQQLIRMALRPAQRMVMEREAAQKKKQGRVRQYQLKARQGGFTTYHQARALHLIWSTVGIDCLTVADKQQRTEKIFEITNRAIRYFPPKLLHEMGSKRSHEVSFKDMESSFYTDTAGSGNPGMGMTIGRLHCSEFAHFENPRAVLAASSPAVVPDGTIVLETTASMFDSEPHEFWREAVNGENGYDAVFIPWWECDPDLYRMPLDEEDELGHLSDEERHLMGTFGLNKEQIKWRRANMREYGVAYFLREYAEDPETCWMAAGELFYDADLLKWLLDRAPADPEEDPRVKGLRHFRKVLPGVERMLIGADTAEGGAKDSFAWNAESYPSGTPMSTYRNNKITPEDFADELNKYARQHNFPILIIEKNLHGITVLRRLRDKHRYPIERLFHRMTHGQDNQRPTREIGWYTSAETKPLILDGVRQRLLAAKAGRMPIPSKSFIRECFTIRYEKDGTVKLTGKDLFVSGGLSWQGRNYPLIPLGNQFLPTVIGRP